MHDDLNAQNGPESADRSSARETPGRSQRGRQELPASPLSDREVPIGVARTSDLVHAWLVFEIASYLAVIGRIAWLPLWIRRIITQLLILE